MPNLVADWKYVVKYGAKEVEQMAQSHEQALRRAIPKLKLLPGRGHMAKVRCTRVETETALAFSIEMGPALSGMTELR